MPTDVPVDDLPSSEQSRPVPPPGAQRTGLRLAFGVGLLFIAAMYFNWPMAFVSAVFAAMFLQAPAPLGAEKGIKLVLLSLAILLVGWVIFSLTVPYPMLFMTAIIGGVVVSYRLAVGGANALLVVLVLLGTLLIPFLNRESFQLGLLIAVWLPLNMGIALVATHVAFAISPSLPHAAEKAAIAESAAPTFDPQRRLVRMCLVTVPFVVVFFMTGAAAVVTLLFTAILSQQLASSTATGPTVAKGMMVANVLGGVGAIVAYEIVVMAPGFGIMAVASLLLCLAYARWFVSGRPDAALAGSALTAALILLGGSMAPFGDDADVKMIDRLIQVGGALVYTLTAFIVVDAFLPERETKPDLPDWKGKGQRAP